MRKPKFLTITSVRVVEHEIELDSNGVPIEPKCPECSVGVVRPKCFLEQGTDCPRHEIQASYDRACKMIKGPYLIVQNVETKRVYNPFYGEDRLCTCGHDYHRHFDWGDDYRPGCKYCQCNHFTEAKSD